MNRELPPNIADPDDDAWPIPRFECARCKNFRPEWGMHWCLTYRRPDEYFGEWCCDHCCRSNDGIGLTCGPEPKGLSEQRRGAPYNEKWFWTWPMARFQSHMRNVSNDKEKT